MQVAPVVEMNPGRVGNAAGIFVCESQLSARFPSGQNAVYPPMKAIKPNATGHVTKTVSANPIIISVIPRPQPARLRWRST